MSCLSLFSVTFTDCLWFGCGVQVAISWLSVVYVQCVYRLQIVIVTDKFAVTVTSASACQSVCVCLTVQVLDREDCVRYRKKRKKSKFTTTTICMYVLYTIKCSF